MALRRTIIHVGLHKTATTYLQEVVWPAAKGYTYLSRPYTQHNHAFNQLQYADDSLYEKSRMISELERMDCDRLLISDESLSGKPVYFSYINRTLIAGRLQALFPEAEVVLFIRDQRDIMLSHYSSYIKMPYGTKPIEALFYKPKSDYSYNDYRKDPSRYDMNTLYYNTNDYFVHLDCFLYSKLVRTYQELFPKCHVFLYEAFRADNAQTLARLAEILGVDLQPMSLEKRNISLSRKALESRRQENLLAAAIPNSYLRKVVRPLNRLSSIRPSRPPETVLAELVADYYWEDNRLLRSLLPSLDWDRHPGKYA